MKINKEEFKKILKMNQKELEEYLHNELKKSKYSDIIKEWIFICKRHRTIFVCSTYG